MNINPSVSVIVCLYNTDPQIFSKTLNSIKNQTLNDFEVIIVDDGSTKYIDENIKLINDLQDDRFTFYNKHHEGKAQTLNFALSKVKGEYIAINDSDDQMYSNRLEYQREFLSLGECEVIFNAMLSNPKHITLPGIYDSTKIEAWNLNYLGNHPVMMMKTKSLDKVKIRFSQIYESIEDNVFNYMLFYSGLIMFYDSTVLETYSIDNKESLHHKSFNPYHHEALYKLFFRTFNYNNINPNFTSIILYNNETWTNNELEKTILNIKLTSNNTKILVIDYSSTKEFNTDLIKYNIIINKDTFNYCTALDKGIELCDTLYFMIISKPIRFYNQNWDLYLVRKFENIYQYDVIQPNLFEVIKIDNYNYINEDGKIEKNNRYGLELQLLNKDITHKKNKLNLYFDYSILSQISILNDDLIFASKKSLFKDFKFSQILDNVSSLNVFISLFMWLNNYHINIDTEFKCGIIDIKLEEITQFNYYTNLYKFAYFFLNETKFLYDKILLENISKNDYEKIINDLKNNTLYYKSKSNFNPISDMSFFLKNINLQYNLWIQ